MWWHTFNSGTQETEKQTELGESEVSLVYREFQASQKYTVRPYLKAGVGVRVGGREVVTTTGHEKV